jgi:hypothetical protein
VGSEIYFLEVIGTRFRPNSNLLDFCLNSKERKQKMISEVLDISVGLEVYSNRNSKQNVTYRILGHKRIQSYTCF